MNLSRYSIRNPLPAVLLFVLLVLCGLAAFHLTPVQDTPDIDVPVVLVTAALPGASPAQLETEVARKMENAIATIPFVRHISSTINDGLVSTSVEFRLGRNVNEAVNEVRDAIARVRSDMPAELRDPVIGKVGDAGVTAVLTYTLSAERMSQEELSWLVDSSVARALMQVAGVGQVQRVGGVNREVLIELDPVRMAALNVSAAAVSAQLQRMQREAPSGLADIGGTTQMVRTLGTVRGVDELAAMDLVLPDGRRVRLDQVARVSDGHAEPRSVVLLDGKPVVAFEVMRNPGASDVQVAAAVRAAVAKLQAEHRTVQFRESLNKVDTVQENYRGSMNLLYEGALLTVLVVWFFLRDGRATVISALALPLSVLPTFLAIHLLGFTLNMVTLLSLALVIGILVDDAIVEIENIMRHVRMGKSPLQAALDAAEEIGLAVVATTLTLVAVFLPTAFLNDIVGQYFRQFGWTASIAVLASLLVARLLTPMMAAYLLRPVLHTPRESRWMAPYLRAVQWCLRRRKTTLGLSALFMLVSLVMAASLPGDFIPPADGKTTNVALELPPGSTLADTRAAAESARALLRQDPDVVQVYAHVGAGGLRFADLQVSLKPRAERRRHQVEVNAALRKALAALPGARVTVGDGDDGHEISFMLASDDPESLRNAVRDVEAAVRTLPGLGSVYSNISLARPEVIVTPDFARAADLGVTADAIGDTLRVATAGDYDQYLAKLNLPDRQLPIRVRLPQATRSDLAALARLSVPGKQGNVPLSSVAELRLDSAPARIERYDRIRKVLVHVELQGRDGDEVFDQILDLPAMKALPSNVKRVRQGDMERQAELRNSFLLAVGIGILCVYMVLVLLFRGFLQPVTVMAALPLSLGGAFGALLLTGHALSMPSMLGLLMLMGISAKNSILLVDYAIRVRREQGLERVAALLEACRNRSQPVIMTTVAMGAGMLPVALGLGADPSFRAPMAVALIGGLLTSTILSLLVIPVVFTYMDDLLLWSRRKFAPLRQAVSGTGTDTEAGAAAAAGEA
ncbi:Multidrug efflux pump subunit AcrB [Duganella sp. CF458]|uniref:efflux RND transporter permease subunit n=1 Tax=Duganella sp. CF458 TaxID=1884368 RepID=UPI0008F0364D|nr:efflux RND transporter permease subunit [Duganella sp. CF458]SFH00086.1 Multidrug efflux pump subunit AcrB [Duganella sp. CF458]